MAGVVAEVGGGKKEGNTGGASRGGAGGRHAPQDRSARPYTCSEKPREKWAAPQGQAKTHEPPHQDGRHTHDGKDRFARLALTPR